MSLVSFDVATIAMLMLAFFACVGIFGKVLLTQIDKRLDERFAAQEIARAEGSRSLRQSIEGYAGEAKLAVAEVSRLERDFLKFQADLPQKVVMRDDYIRGQAVIDAKQDRQYSEIQALRVSVERLNERLKGS